jgi:hypothetical protein
MVRVACSAGLGSSRPGRASHHLSTVEVVPRVTAAQCIKRFEAMSARLPQAEVRLGGHDERHRALTVRGRNFAYFTDDHHGDGRLALIVKAPPGEQQILIASDPERFFVPAYLGPRGWVGLRLDVASPDWTEAEELLVESYCLCAPKKLANEVSATLPG